MPSGDGSARRPAGDLHSPPDGPVQQVDETVAAGAERIQLLLHRVGVGAGLQFHVLATAQPQQPVDGRVDRLRGGKDV